MQKSTNFPTYVFAAVDPRRVRQVVEELKRNSQIDFVAPVTGRYDIALRLKPSTPEQVYQAVQQIRKIDGIRTTETHSGFDGLESKKLDGQMALGISLLNVEEQPFENTLKQLSNVPGHVEAWAVPGRFDIVALWQARSCEDIMKSSVEKLMQLEGISKSETLFAYSPFIKA